MAKIVIGMPSYKGPDLHAYQSHLRMHEYFGRLAERGDHEFIAAHQPGNSIIGMARDQICQAGMDAGADYIFMYDDDMILPLDALERMMADDKDVVVALAFTSRFPIGPVLWKFRFSWDAQKQAQKYDIEPILDYPRDTLFRVDAVGTGVVLIKTEALKRIPKPWFYGGLHVGEDILFSMRCLTHGVEIWCDSRVKTRHKPNAPLFWHDEEFYDLYRSGKLSQVQGGAPC